MSNLSKIPDGYGYYYGFRDNGDHRQINVRHESGGWKAYVGGEPIDGAYPALIAAEAAAYLWMDANPVTEDPPAQGLDSKGAIDTLKKLFGPDDTSIEQSSVRDRGR